MLGFYYECPSLRVSCLITTTMFCIFLQNNSQTEVPRETPAPDPHPESTTLTGQNHYNSTEDGRDIPGSPFPTIVVSQYNSPPQQPEEAETNPAPQPAVYSSLENCSQDKSEDCDNTFTSHFKMVIKGLTRSRSQESLASAKFSCDEEQLDETAGLQQEGVEGQSWLSFSAKLNKREKTCFRMSAGANKTKGKEALQRGDESQRGQASWEQLEATKAIFDLLKEISGMFKPLTLHDFVM